MLYRILPMAVLDEYQHVDPMKLIDQLLKIPIALQFFTQFCKERYVSRIGWLSVIANVAGD